MKENIKDSLGPLEQALAYRIYRLSRLLRHNLRQILVNAGLDVSPEQYFMLYRLYQKDGVPQAQLADPAFGDYPNMTRMIDGLEKKGLVERRNDPEDRRRYLITLLEKGRTLMKEVEPAILAERGRIHAAFKDGELDVFTESLDRFLQLYKE